MYDLHTHTTASDGQYTAAELVRCAYEKSIAVLAITDHDSIGSIREGEKAAKEFGIRFIPGIEISVKGAREMHILGYGIDVEAEGVPEMCTQFQQLREERKYRILEFLEHHGVSLTLEQVEKQAGSQLIARPHFARAMVEAGYVSTIREAFDQFLGTTEFDQVERPKPTPEEGIAMIQNIGGIAVLAHPSSLKMKPDELEKQLEELIHYGLKGLECHYSAFTQEQSNLYLELAHKYKLLITGGSDFHGEKVKPDITLGGFQGNTFYNDGIEIYNKIKKAGKL